MGDLVNEIELLGKYMEKYIDISYGLMVGLLIILVFACMLLWVYYQEKYLHALRTIERICADVPIDADKLAVYVHESKRYTSKKWREYFE